jgi:Pentapeptide repeats (8 copies)
MDDELREKWLEKWEAIYPGSAEPFRNFLDHQNLPDQIKNDLAREPLLLYLLAVMHHKGEINNSSFENITNSSQAKIIIYNKLFDYVIDTQRENLQKKFTGFEPKHLKTIITEAALCVVQGGTESSTIEILNKRLPKDIKDKIVSSSENKLTNALTAFYFKQNSNDDEDKGGGFEFIHKSFCEFLFAKRIYNDLPKCTDEKIYDLLGYGGLTLEIVEYLRGLWEQDENKVFKPVDLFDHLENFYWKWCKGEFIDAESPTLPQMKMQDLRKQLPQIGQRQVDIYTGLNVMILLLELHRYAKTRSELEEEINFNLGKSPTGDSDPWFLSRIIGYCECIGTNGFSRVVGPFLNGANLQGANLEGVNLVGANLEGVNLEGVNLEGADLRGTNLEGANLEHAKLIRANLRIANLEGANLEDANLNGADFERAGLKGANLARAVLKGANLARADLEDAVLYPAILIGADFVQANLQGANLECVNLARTVLDSANLQNIIWDKRTIWPDKEEVRKAFNIPEKLKRQLGLL